MLKDKILYVLEKGKGKTITGGQLALKFGVSRTAIWKAIHALQDAGHDIISIPNSGYQLLPTNDALVSELIHENLKTDFIGKKIEILSTVHSTNQYLKEKNGNIDNGFVVIADEQTQGRGRRNRTFISTNKNGIYMSILLKPKLRDKDIRFLTICAAVAVSQAIETVCGVSAEIKWVNDIFCRGKKICGILTEANISGELQELDSLIIGIGINTKTVPNEIKEIATSIQEATGICGVRNSLIAEVLNRFESVYLDYAEHDNKRNIIAYYDSKLFIKDRKVQVTDTDQVYLATVLGIDDAGALIVKDEHGRIHHLTTGEILLNW